ncbi:MAG: hypothetical protein ACI4MN_04735 [Candidatus Coproplasma sp.]
MNSLEQTLPETNVGSEPEQTTKKPSKLFVIISYAIALASLIAMLFVPLFGEDMFIKYFFVAVSPILNLFHVTIPDAVYGTFFINVGSTIDLTVGIILTLIFLSVVLSLIMLIPVIVCKAKSGANLRCAFAAEYISFIAVLAYVCYEMYCISFWGMASLWNDYSLLIPLGVIMIVMAAQSIKYKGSLGVMKLVIFILSLLTLFTLFDIVTFIPILESPLQSLSGLIGAYDADVTFIGDYCSAIIPFAFLCNNRIEFAGFDQFTTLLFQIITIALPLMIVGNIFLDTIGLIAGEKTTKEGKPNPHTVWFAFAVIRYSVIILFIAATVILSFVFGYLNLSFGKVGIYIYFTLIFVFLSLIVEIVRFCVCKSRLKAYNAAQYEVFKNEKLVINDETLANENAEGATEETVEAAETVEGEYQTNMFGDTPVEETAPVAEAVEEPTESVGEQLTITEEQPAEEQFIIAPEALEAQSEEVVEAEVVDAEEVVEAEVVEDAIDAEIVEAEVVEAEVVDDTATIEPVEEQVKDTYNEFTLFGEVSDAEKDEDDKKIDPFVDKLTDAERAQFYDVFINRNKGKFSSIPAYTLNGDNSDFFPAVFVHINRMRNICSDSLLAKIYKEIDKD